MADTPNYGLVGNPNLSPQSNTPNYGLVNATNVAPTMDQGSLSQQLQNLFPTNKIEEKKQKLEIPTAVKELAIGKTAGAGYYGNTSHFNNFDVQNFLNLDPYTLQETYGEEALDIRNQIHNNLRSSAFDKTNTTALDEKLMNYSTGIGMGATNALGGIVAFGAGALNKDAGAAVSEATQGLSGALESLRSDKTRRSLDLTNEIMRLQSEDADKRYERELANGADPTMAGLSRLGEGVMLSAKAILSNPDSIVDNVGQGVGSLIPNMAVGALTGGSSIPLQMGAQAAMAGAMGAGEGYTNSQQEIQAMSHDDLMRGSPDYQKLIADGYSESEAKNIIANNAGLQAGLMAAPANAIGGAAMFNYLKAPFKITEKAAGQGIRKGISSAFKTTLEEGADEFFQGGATQLATNLAIRNNADKDRSLIKDLGEQATMEAIGGLGTAGGTQSIAAVRNIKSSLVNKLVPQSIKEGNAFVTSLNELGNSVQEITEKYNNYSTGNAANGNSTNNSTNSTATSNNNLNTNNTNNDDSSFDLQTLVNTGTGKAELDLINNLQQKDNMDLSQHNLHNVMDLMSVYENYLSSDKISVDEKLDIIRFKKAKIDAVNKLAKMDENSLKNSTDPFVIDHLDDIIFNINKARETASNPTFGKLYHASNEEYLNILNNLTEPKDTDSMQSTIDLIDSMPDRVSQKSLDYIQKGIDKGYNLSPEYMAKYDELKTIHQENEALKNSADTLAKISGANPEEVSSVLNMVNRDNKNLTAGKNFFQAMSNKFGFKGVNVYTENNPYNGLPSLGAYVNAYRTSTNSKERADIKKHLSNFIRNTANKLEAMDKSHVENNNNEVEYQQIKPSGNPAKAGKRHKVFYNPKVAASRLMYGSVLMEYIEMVKAYEAMNGKNDGDIGSITPISPRALHTVKGLEKLITDSGMEILPDRRIIPRSKNNSKTNNTQNTTNNSNTNNTAANNNSNTNTANNNNTNNTTNSGNSTNTSVNQNVNNTYNTGNTNTAANTGGIIDSKTKQALIDKYGLDSNYGRTTFRKFLDNIFNHDKVKNLSSDQKREVSEYATKLWAKRDPARFKDLKEDLKNSEIKKILKDAKVDVDTLESITAKELNDISNENFSKLINQFNNNNQQLNNKNQQLVREILRKYGQNTPLTDDVKLNEFLENTIEPIFSEHKFTDKQKNEVMDYIMGMWAKQNPQLIADLKKDLKDPAVNDILKNAGLLENLAKASRLLKPARFNKAELNNLLNKFIQNNAIDDKTNFPKENYNGIASETILGKNGRNIREIFNEMVIPYAKTHGKSSAFLTNMYNILWATYFNENPEAYKKLMDDTFDKGNFNERDEKAFAFSKKKADLSKYTLEELGKKLGLSDEEFNNLFTEKDLFDILFGNTDTLLNAPSLNSQNKNLRKMYKISKDALGSMFFTDRAISLNDILSKIKENHPNLTENELSKLKDGFNKIYQAIFTGLTENSSNLNSLSKSGFNKLQYMLDNEDSVTKESNVAYGWMSSETKDFPLVVKRAIALAMLDTLGTSEFTNFSENFYENYEVPNLNPEKAALIAQSISTEDFINRVSKNIQKYMYIKAGKDTPLKYSQGIFKGLAAQAIMLAEKKGLVVRNLLENVTSYKNGKSIRLSRFQIEPNFKRNVLDQEKPNSKNNVTDLETPSLFSVLPAVLQDLTNTESSTNYSLSPIQELGNVEVPSRLKPTSEQKKTLKIHNNTGFKFNMPMLNAFKNIADNFGVETLHSIFGYTDVVGKEDNYNIKDLSSIMGKNTTILSGFNKLIQLLNLPEGTNVEDAAIYFTSKIISNGRVMFNGVSPQNNKLLRHLMTPNKATYNLEDENHRNLFLRAVAQGLGSKTQTIRYNGENDAIKAILDNNAKDPNSEAYIFNEAIEAFRAYDKNSSSQNSEKLYKALERIKEVTDEIPLTIHSLQEYSRYLNALDNKEKSFNSNIFLELDGMANGAAMTFLNFNKFDINKPEIKKLYNSVGIFFPGDKYSNTSEYFADGNKDFYGLMDEINSNEIRENIKKEIEADTSLSEEDRKTLLSNDKDLKEYFDKKLFTDGKIKDSLSYLKFFENIGLVDRIGNYPIFSRNNYKNPTMTFNYLAGKDTMTLAVIDDEIMPLLYRAISEVIDKNGKYGGDLLSHPYFEGISEKGFKDIFGISPKEMASPNYNISTKNEVFKHNSLFKLVENSLIAPMYNSVASRIGESRSIIELGTQLSQIQQAQAEFVFSEKLKPYLKEIKPKDDKNPTLYALDTSIISEYKVKELLAETIQEVGLLGTSYGSVDVSDTIYMDEGNTLVKVTNPEDNSMGFKYSVLTFSPKKGVKAGANLNIFNADSSILNKFFNDLGENGIYSLNDDMKEHLMQVFDGYNISPEDTEIISKALNKAVFNTFMEDNITPLIQSLDKNLHHPSATHLATLKFTDHLGNKFNPIERLRSIRTELQEAAKSANIVKDIMDKYGVTVQQMVGAVDGYTHVGTETRQDTDTIETKYNELKTEAKEKAKISSDVKSVINENSYISNDKDGYLAKIGKPVIYAHYRDNKNIHPDLVRVMRLLERSGSRADVGTLRNTGIYVGTKDRVQEQLNKDREARGLSRVELQQGLYDPITNNIYIDDAFFSHEVLAHEMIHAAVARLINAYYENPKRFPLENHYIKRLEAIMDEFLGSNGKMGSYEALARGIQNSKRVTPEFDNVMKTIEHINSLTNPADRMNEFLSYTLSERALKAAAQSTTLSDKIKDVAKRVKRVILKMLGINPTPPNKSIYENTLFIAEILSMSENIDNAGRKSNKEDTSNKNAAQSAEPLHKRNTNKKGYSFSNVFSKLNTLDSIKVKNYATVANVVKNTLKSLNMNFTKEQESTFTSTYTAILLGTFIDPNLRLEAEKLVYHAMDHISEKDFDTKNQYEAFISTTELGSLLNIDLFAKMIALSQTSDKIADVFSKIPLPNNTRSKAKTFDDMVNNLGERIATKLDDVIDGSNKNSVRDKENIADALDSIVNDSLNTTNNNNSVFNQVDNVFNKADSFVNDNFSNIVSKSADFVWNKLDNVNSDNGAINLAATTGKVVASFFSKEKGEIMADTFSHLMNKYDKFPKIVREFWDEMRGTTRDNQYLVRISKKAKGIIAKVRHGYKQEFPKHIKSMFENSLSEKQYSDVFHSLGKSDLAVFSDNEVNEIINGTFQGKQSLENQLTKPMLNDIDKLAEYIVNNKVTGHSLARNAYAIAQRYKSPALKETIDKVLSLAIWEKTNKEAKDSLKEIYQKYPEGIDKINSIIRYTKGVDNKRHGDNFSGWKGYLPKEKTSSEQVIVMPISERERLENQGFKFLREVNAPSKVPSNLSNAESTYAYFISKFGAKDSIQQGALQYIQGSTMGSSVFGYNTIDDSTAGRISVEQYMNSGLRNSNEVIPIYDKKGFKIVGYEFAIPNDVAVPDAGNRNTNIADSLGTWIGRQFEEDLAHGANIAAIQELGDIYRNAIGDTLDEFVNIAQSEDKTHKDVWNAMPQELKKEIFAEFGKGNFFVRKDMINLTIGYRPISVGNFFTEHDNNIDPKVKNVVVKTSQMILGKDAYNKLVAGEKILKAAVATAKDIIVIRSIVVPTVNLLSNVVQLMLIGVPLKDIYKGFNLKFKEVRAYTENRNKILDLEFQQIGETNPDKIKELKARINLLENSNKKMTIYPLINAGELSTITEDLKLENDSLLQGKWLEKLEGTILDKTPKPLHTALKQALMMKDTAIYNMMFLGTMYGDFLAKSIFYDFQINKGVLPDEAMALTTDEFVNYDVNPGRVRSYLDSMGATWFMNYKIRSVKAAHRLMRDRPFSALLAGLGMTPSLPYLNLGNPITDNFWTKFYSGGLGYSLGWGQMFRSPSLLPAVAVFN